MYRKIASAVLIALLVKTAFADMSDTEKALVVVDCYEATGTGADPSEYRDAVRCFQSRQGWTADGNLTPSQEDILFEAATAATAAH